MSRILSLLQKEAGGEYHPLVAILQIAKKTDDQRLEYDCHKTLATYVESQRRSVEIKSEDGSELVHLSINIGGDDD